MTENSETPIKAQDNRRNIWIRAIFMLLMVLAFHVCVTVLLFVTIMQFLMMLLNAAPNARLVSFGRGMGGYLRQVANYLTFATEELPFPFSDWPAGE